MRPCKNPRRGESWQLPDPPPHVSSLCAPPGVSFPRVHPQAARRPPPPRAGDDAPRRTRPSSRKPLSCVFQRPMPTREPPKTRGSRGHLLQTHPPGPGPPLQGLTPRGLKTSAPRPPCQPQPGPHKARRKTIVFEDELLSQALLGAKKPIGAIPKGHTPRPHPVPDYELKYPPVSSARERSRYAAVFQDLYGEYLELQREVGCAQAKLRQLEARLSSLPPPQSQKEAQVAVRVWREFEKKQTDPGFLDKQARCHYLKGKLRHLKTQIQKFDDRRDSEGSVYF
uniref:occludin/ELL domain-containing protein 1 isoform X2 n=1 Tax=Callithrix jacchus TaxID=9483 RepID=UPI0004F04C26|nr:occludin/ELL domain-containing protein 1 isoform X2 [Callithrix jacchus]